MRIHPGIARLLVSCIGPLLVAQDRPREDVDLGTLIRALDDPVFDARAFLALVERGQEALPGLLALIRAPTNVGRELTQRRHARAFRALRMLDASSAELAVPQLTAMHARVQVEDTEVTANTLLTLIGRLPHRRETSADLETDLLASHVKGQAERTAPGLDVFGVRDLPYLCRMHARIEHLGEDSLARDIEGLGSENPMVIEFAAECIGRRGPDAHSALPALRATLAAGSYPTEVSFHSGRTAFSIHSDFSSSIQDAISTAIARIAPQDPLARRGLALLLRADDPRERVAAAMTLGTVTDDDVTEVCTALLAAAHDDDPLVAAEAVTALGRVGHSSPEIQNRLKQLVAAGGALGARAKVALRHIDESTPRKR